MGDEININLKEAMDDLQCAYNKIDTFFERITFGEFNYVIQEIEAMHSSSTFSKEVIRIIEMFKRFMSKN